MLGSSSTTILLSFSAMRSAFLSFFSGTVDRQQERKCTSTPRFAIYPDLSAMRLHQALCNCQPESHPGCISVHADKVLEDFLMMFSGNSGPRVGNRHFHAVVFLRPRAPPLVHGSAFSNTPLPKMRSYAQSNSAAGGGMLQRVVEQIGHGLLNFLVVELENRNPSLKLRVQAHLLPLERFLPSHREFFQAFEEIVLPQMKHQLPAL